MSTVDCSLLPTSYNSTCKTIQVSFTEETYVEKDDCYNEFDNGKSYNGYASTTESGLKCMPWSKNKENGSFSNNYCRNIDGTASKPWCYIDKQNNIPQFCKINTCELNDGFTAPIFVKFGVFAVCLFFVVMVMLLRSRFVRKRNGNKAKLAQNYFKCSNSHKSLTSYNEKENHTKNFSEINVPLVKRSAVKVSENILGFGSFGSVFLAEVKDNNIENKFKEKTTSVQIENYLELSSSQQQFLLKILQQKLTIIHPNVTKLVALVKEVDNLMEIYEYGNGLHLSSYLSSTISCEFNSLMNILTQISKGMAYLELKGLVHQDLAARNIVLTDINQIKIINFSLRRIVDKDCYFYLKNYETPMPVRWMSPETMISNTQFSSKSDVWSFGVLMWELFTYSTQYTPLPYSHLKDEEVVNNIVRGQLLSCPQKCPEYLFTLMQKCLIKNILQRPTFKEIEALLCGRVIQNSQVDQEINSRYELPSYSSIDLQEDHNKLLPSPNGTLLIT